MIVIYVPTNLRTHPLYCVRVPLGHIAFGRWRVADSITAMVCRCMNRSVNFTNITSDMFHDIDLSTRGPAAIRPICWEHPNGRPCSPCYRKLSTDLYAVPRAPITMVF